MKKAQFKFTTLNGSSNKQTFTYYYDLMEAYASATHFVVGWNEETSKCVVEEIQRQQFEEPNEWDAEHLMRLANPIVRIDLEKIWED